MAKISKKIKRTLGHRQKKKQAPGKHKAASHQNKFQQALRFHQAGRLPAGRSPLPTDSLGGT